MQSAVGIMGGTGLYDIKGLTDVEEVEVETPFGAPSSAVTVGSLDGTRLLFIARHGKGHVLAPSEINYRANIFALKQLGAAWCISVSAVGSLQEHIAPGDVVIPDQYIDRTRSRASTFYGKGVVVHVPFADPVCPVLCDALHAVATEIGTADGVRVHNRGIYVCMEGPQFSTRAESHMYREWGASLIGMTAIPEAKLAREAELAYATLALVTDYDCWRTASADVDVTEILAVMKKNSEFARKVLKATVRKLQHLNPSPLAANALAQSIITPPQLIPAKVKEQLQPLIGKYVS